MTNGKFNGIKSSEFFKWLISEKNEKIICYIKKIFNRTELYEVSKDYKNSNTTIKDIFGNIQIFDDIKDKDSAKCYSVFQYIEMLFLISNFVLNNRSNDNVNLWFLLPNDETKYYTYKYFNNDIVCMLKFMNIDAQPNVNFLPFVYGKKLDHRPYLFGKKYVDKITIDMLI